MLKYKCKFVTLSKYQNRIILNLCYLFYVGLEILCFASRTSTKHPSGIRIMSYFKDIAYVIFIYSHILQTNKNPASVLDFLNFIHLIACITVVPDHFLVFSLPHQWSEAFQANVHIRNFYFLDTALHDTVACFHLTLRPHIFYYEFCWENLEIICAVYFFFISYWSFWLLS